MEPDAEAVRAYERRFREATGYAGTLTTLVFGDSPSMADELAALTREGPKRATAGWARDPRAMHPDPGRHWIVLDGSGRPVCVIRTGEVLRRAFREVGPGFAWDEGEGDRTLEHWRAVHRAFFDRQAEELGITFDEDEPLVLQRFSPVHPAPAPPAPLVERDGITVGVRRPDERGLVRELVGRPPDAPATLEATGGFAADACPALLAREGERVVGTLVFRPGRQRTSVAAAAVRGGEPAVRSALEHALDGLRASYDWGRISRGDPP